VFEKVTQYNARYQELDTLMLNVHLVKMPAVNGKRAEKTKGRLLSVMVHLKRGIVEENPEENCLAHALVIAMASDERSQLPG
jgi:hypothetical protein